MYTESSVFIFLVNALYFLACTQNRFQGFELWLDMVTPKGSTNHESELHTTLEVWTISKNSNIFTFEDVFKDIHF